MHQIVAVHDLIQDDYSYARSHLPGADFDEHFVPDLTPKQMLELGIFGGWYLNDCREEYPADWFLHARLSDHGPDPACNFFEVMASQPLAVWQAKGWTYPDDPRGWFQWYARYFMGRRLPEEDARQIKRWYAIRRHISQLQKACAPGDLSCRRRQRQALLHWAYDSQKL